MTTTLLVDCYVHLAVLPDGDNGWLNQAHTDVLIGNDDVLKTADRPP